MLRDPATADVADAVSDRRILVVGAGRMGSALVPALRAAGFDVRGPASRGEDGREADVVLLAVPDSAIAEAAAAIRPGPVVGHLSGATGLGPLAPHPRFSLHPLTTVAGPAHDFRGGVAAIDGDSDQALREARRLAAALGLDPFRVREEDRVAYHAAASIASNFLFALEDAAERLAATANVERSALVPLVRATVDNWARLGAADALTGPIARGDRDTVAAQRAAIAERTPDLLPLFDAMVIATQRLADSRPRE